MSEIRQWADGSLITREQAEAEGLSWSHVCLYSEPYAGTFGLTEKRAEPGEFTEAWRAALNDTQPVRYADTFVTGYLADGLSEQPVRTYGHRSWQDRARIWIADTCDAIVDDVVRRLVDYIDPDIKTRR